MNKINSLLKIPALLIMAALALAPYAEAFELVGDDMDYILSHVSNEEWEAAKKIWRDTIQLNLDHGSEPPLDMGVVVEPSLSEWGIERDPSNPDVYILSLEWLPQKPYSKPETQTVEQASPEYRESREAEKIAWTLWGNYSHDKKNITFTVPSTGNKWLFVPIDYKHKFFDYGKLDAQGNVVEPTSIGETVLLEVTIQEWAAEGKDISQLLALQKQTQELIAQAEAKREREAQEAAASAKSGKKKDSPLAVTPVEVQTATQNQPATNEAVNASEETQNISPAVSAKASSHEAVNESQKAKEPATAQQNPVEQSPKKRLSLFKRILNWFR